MKMIVQAIMAVALVAAVAHSLPHASVDAVVPEPDFYETAGAVKAQHIPVPDAVLAEVEFPNAGSAELLATGSGDMEYPHHDEHHEAVETKLLATGSAMELLATGSAMELLATMPTPPPTFDHDGAGGSGYHHDEMGSAMFDHHDGAGGSGYHHDEHHDAVETELLATGSAMELLATGSAMPEFPQHEAVETELLATGSGDMDYPHHDEHHEAVETKLLATGSAMPTPAHCDMCVHEFADAGGCDAWKSEDWDKVHAAVPDGCYPCADEAEQHCGMDSHSSLVFLARMQAIDNKN